jgi:hypothetical protein
MTDKFIFFNSTIFSSPVFQLSHLQYFILQFPSTVERVCRQMRGATFADNAYNSGLHEARRLILGYLNRAIQYNSQLLIDTVLFIGKHLARTQKV